MYDPTVGRWLTEDPIGFDAGDANLYRYVGNSATTATDPSGLEEAVKYDAAPKELCYVPSGRDWKPYSAPYSIRWTNRGEGVSVGKGHVFVDDKSATRTDPLKNTEKGGIVIAYDGPDAASIKFLTFMSASVRIDDSESADVKAFAKLDRRRRLQGEIGEIASSTDPKRKKWYVDSRSSKDPTDHGMSGIINSASTKGNKVAYFYDNPTGARGLALDGLARNPKAISCTASLNFETYVLLDDKPIAVVILGAVRIGTSVRPL